MTWCTVGGKYFDLSSFKHPGGPIAMSLANGRDADLLIRSYHPFNEQKVRDVLKKYEVDENGTNNTYTAILSRNYKPSHALIEIATDTKMQMKSEAVFSPTDSTFAKELKSLANTYFNERYLNCLFLYRSTQSVFSIRTATTARWLEYAVMLLLALIGSYLTVKVSTKSQNTLD